MVWTVAISDDVYHKLYEMKAWYTEVERREWSLRKLADLAIRNRYDIYLQQRKEEEEAPEVRV